MEEKQKNIEKMAVNENVETSNAIIDEETNQVIDVEELLNGQDPVASKLNNLMKIGVTIEQIKMVYEISGGAVPGLTMDAALDELNKVFYILARGVNEAPNAFVVNLITGNLDIEATMKRAIELGYGEEFITSSKAVVMNNDENNVLDAIIAGWLEESRLENTLMFAEIDKSLNSDFLYNIKGITFDLSDKDIVEIAKKFGVLPEVLKNAISLARKNIEDGSIMSHTENNVHDAIAKLMRYKLDNRNNRQQEICIDEIKAAIEACPEEERKKYEKYFNEDGSLKIEDLINDETDFMHLRNEGAINVRFTQFLTGEGDFSQLDPHAKEKLLIALTRSLAHIDDNENMAFIGSLIAKQIGIEYSYEGIRGILNTIVDRDLDTDEKLINLAKRGELNPYTAEVKYDEIRSNLNGTIGKSDAANLQERVTAKAQREYDLRETAILTAVQRIGTRLNDTGNDFRGYEIALIFKHFYYENKDSVETKALAKYIENNFKFFEDFFKDRENLSIFNNDGTVSITRLDMAVDGAMLERENDESVQQMIGAIKGSRDRFESEKNKNLIARIKELASRDKVYIKNITRIEMINVAEYIDLLTISKSDWDELLTIDPKLTDALVARKQEVDKKVEEMKITRTLRLDNKTKKDALRETALLLEARIVAAKGTALYGKLTRERDEFYKNNPNAVTEIGITIRDEKGMITAEGQNELDEYLEGYRRKKISNHLRAIVANEIDEPEEKRNVAKWLIVAMTNGNYKVRQEAIQKMKKVYPEYDTDDAQVTDEERLDQLFEKAYGQKISREKQDELKKKLSENFTKLILKESIVIFDKELTDENFHDFFDNHAESFDASRTNLTVSELQNYFEGSKIPFTESDDKELEQLYTQSTINSWLESKKDADRLSILAIKSIMQNSKIRTGATQTDKDLKAYLDGHAEETKQWLKEDGSIVDKYKAEVYTYVDNKMTSEILKGFSRNVFKEDKGFYEMSADEQKTVIEQVLVSLGHIDSTVDPLTRKVLSKLTYRALEMMNTNEHQVVKFVDDKLVIDEEAFHEVYKGINDGKRVVFGGTFSAQIKETYDAYKKGFFLEKAEAYSKKSEENFHKLKSKKYDERLMEIEQLKVREREESKEKHSDKVKYETRTQAYSRAVSKKANKSLGSKKFKATATHRVVKSPKLSGKETFYIDEDGVKVVINETNKDQIKSKKDASSLTIDFGKNEEASVIQDSAEHIVNSTNVVREGQNNDPVQSEEIRNEYMNNETQNILQAEEVDASAAENKEENKKDFFKPLKEWWKRMTTPRIGDGKEPTKKIGFFAKLFGKKEEPKVDENETNNNSKEKVIQDGLSHIVLDNKDGKYDIGSSGNGKSQDTGKVSDAQQQEQEEFGELG